MGEERNSLHLDLWEKLYKDMQADTGSGGLDLWVLLCKHHCSMYWEAEVFPPDIYTQQHVSYRIKVEKNTNSKAWKMQVSIKQQRNIFSPVYYKQLSTGYCRSVLSTVLSCKTFHWGDMPPAIIELKLWILQ